MHVTSLPNDFAIGDLGEGAYRFIDFLHQAGQRIWQILPLGPPATGNSPYSCYSAFAGNPLLISPTKLYQSGLLTEAELCQHASCGHVDYDQANAAKPKVLEASFTHFQRGADPQISHEFEQFCAANQFWLDDYSLFIALVHHFGTSDWTAWDKDLAQRRDVALAHWDKQLTDRIALERYKQFLFYRQWQQVREYANQRSIRILGDMPIFVDHQGSDVWANQEIFSLDQAGRPEHVAGVPPDYFSETGQLWGNPLYDWEQLAAQDFDWWTKRLTFAFRHVDLLRIDHFRAFDAYWKIPSEAETAAEGHWAPGPGDGPFRAAEAAMNQQLPIIAEDLGLITDEVHQLRDQLGYPGMRVLQFGYADESDDYHRPSAFPEHSAAYTGTHDNETTVGWHRHRLESGDELVTRYLSDKNIWQLIGLVIESKADTAIFPMQDILGLGNEARMNIPGEADGNWVWRCGAESLNSDTAARLLELTRDSGRTNST